MLEEADFTRNEISSLRLEKESVLEQLKEANGQAEIKKSQDTPS